MTQRPPCASPGTVASEGGEAGPSGGGESGGGGFVCIVLTW